MPLPPPLYYFAAWTDSDCLCGCDHFHMSVASAVACTRSPCAGAGAYVVAVEKGEYRELNAKEEKEFQFHIYGWGKAEKKQEFTLLPWPRTDPEPAD